MCSKSAIWQDKGPYYVTRKSVRSKMLKFWPCPICHHDVTQDMHVRDEHQNGESVACFACPCGAQLQIIKDC